MLRGVVAAAVTPLREDGAALDEGAFEPLVDFLVAGGVDGIFALGTTGEGILLSREERMRAGELFVAAARGRVAVAVHCGAQTTEETCALAAAARGAGADAVAVIPPPYYPLDDTALLAHLLSAAEAAAPLPFYAYEFRARAGYSISVDVVAHLRERAPNLAGLKVSNSAFEDVEPYIGHGLDVFVGSEALVPRGLERGAAGAVSGLATVLPERVVTLVRDGADTSGAGAARAALDRFPFQAAAKHVLGRRGVPVRSDVRAPLRKLTDEEREELDRWLESS